MIEIIYNQEWLVEFFIWLESITRQLIAYLHAIISNVSSIKMEDFPQGIILFLLTFTFFYPVFMSYIWMIGATIYFLNWEHKKNKWPEDFPLLEQYPPVSILVPCHNEAEIIEETISYLMRQNYPEFEIIAIDDGSTDNTMEILTSLTKRYDKVRVIQLKQNQGKAKALQAGALLSSNEFLVGIDADALLSFNAVAWMIKHFSSSRVGAVTGNPRVRNRSTLLGRIQVGEFSSVVGLIKRAQRVTGRIFTVSGVVACFRKSALQRVGYWSSDMITEDIDITWKLQLDHWCVRFEPKALCWILMPETLSGLWKQRVRWAQGGAEVFLRYFTSASNWSARRLWPILFDFFVSVCWAYLIFALIIIGLLSHFSPLFDSVDIPSFIPVWGRALFALTFLLQIILSIIIESHYEKGIAKIYFWLVWYPLCYWFISITTTVVGLPKALFKKRGTRAVWVSPDRGIR